LIWWVTYIEFPVPCTQVLNLILTLSKLHGSLMRGTCTTHRRSLFPCRSNVSMLKFAAEDWALFM